MDGEAVELLTDPALDDGAEPTFRRVIDRLRSAERSVEIHMFVWRSDDIGNRVAREVLVAADRGVRFRIKKDLGAQMYERIEMNRKSLFRRKLSLWKRLSYAVSSTTFPDTFVRDSHDHALGDAILAHSRVAVEWVDHTHTKYYVFDEGALVLGSVNLEDRHRGYRDCMVEIRGEERVSRFRSRARGDVAYDGSRDIDFVFNRPGAFEIKGVMLGLLARAVRSVYVEMAYVSDPEILESLIRAARRGVEVTILFSREANIGNDLNYRSLHQLLKRAPFRVSITDKMIHSKMMWFDESIAILGSANLSVFSLQQAEEADVVIQGVPSFSAALGAEVARRLRESRPVSSRRELRGYNRLLSSLQQLHQRLR